MNSREFQVCLDFWREKNNGLVTTRICPGKIEISYYHSGCFNLPDTLNFLKFFGS